MQRLPTDQWQISFYPDCFAVAAHLNGGGLYWTKFKYSDLPSPRVVVRDGLNTLENHVGLDDLKRVFIDVVDIEPVRSRPTAGALDLA